MLLPHVTCPASPSGRPNPADSIVPNDLLVATEPGHTHHSDRSWLKNQVHGELDDNKLVDGATGEKNIYKRRGENPNVAGVQKRPKRLRFVIDVSRSMGRMNGM
jgi:hypothetical protein